MDNIDLDNLTTVKKSSVQKQNYDLRYSYAGDRFTVSDRFYANKGLNSNGFTFHLANNGKIPLISIRSNDESVFYKGKAGDQEKSNVFSYSILGTGLQDLGMIDPDSDTKFEDFELEFVKEKDGADFYMIKPVDEDSDVEESEEETVAPEPVADTTEANAPEDEDQTTEDEEEEEDDPFDL